MGEQVMIYPPRKVLQQNMQSIYLRRRSNLPSLDLQNHPILRFSTFQRDTVELNDENRCSLNTDNDSPTPFQLLTFNTGRSQSTHVPVMSRIAQEPSDQSH